MLNQEKVKDMTRMAIYESRSGEKELYVTSFRRGDYVALQLIKSLILGTIAAIIILALYFLRKPDFIEGLTTLENIKDLAINMGIFYIVFIAAYLALTFIWARRKYKLSKAHAEPYMRNLKRVVRSYMTPEEIADEEAKEERKKGFLKRRK